MPASKDAAVLLGKAAQKLGGVEVFARRLGISARALQLCIDGKKPVSDALYLKAVDVILEETVGGKSPRPRQ